MLWLLSSVVQPGPLLLGLLSACPPAGRAECLLLPLQEGRAAAATVLRADPEEMRAEIAVALAHGAALEQAPVLADLLLPEDVVLPQLTQPQEEQAGEVFDLLLCVDPVL